MIVKQWHGERVQGITEKSGRLVQGTVVHTETSAVLIWDAGTKGENVKVIPQDKAKLVA
jgi:hypothetical protein